MKKLLVKLGLSSFLLFTATGCGTQAAKAIQPKIDLAKNSEVAVNINKYTDGLDNLNELLKLYGQGGIQLVVKPVLNKTSQQNLPLDVTLMVNSALNEIGDEVTLYRENLEQGDVFTPHEGLYYVEGAITEYDVLERSNRGVNVGIHAKKGKIEADGNSESSDDDQTAKLTIDFNIIDSMTNAYVSKVHTSNSIKIIKKSESRDYGFSILGSGFGVDASVSKEQGKHAAIRLLIDLSMIELVSKLRKLPYWICVPGAKKDRRLQRDIGRAFNTYDTATKKMLIHYFLRLINTQESNQGIIDYKKRYAIMPANADMTAQLYISLLENAQKIKNNERITGQSKQAYQNLL